MQDNTLNFKNVQGKKPAIRDIIIFDIIKIAGEDVNSVDARTLHEALESKQEFAHWIKAKVLENPFFQENQDYALLDNPIKQTRNTRRGGHNKKDYALTWDTAKKVAMAEQTSRGEDVRNYFLDCEKQRNELLKIKSTTAIKPPTMSKIASDLGAGIKIAKLFGLEGNQALLSANNMIVNKYKDFSINPLLESGVNLVIESKTQYLTPSEIGKQNGKISGKKINQMIKDAGFQKETRGQKNKLIWVITNQGKPHCQMQDTGKKHNGAPIMQVKWKSDILNECAETTI